MKNWFFTAVLVLCALTINTGFSHKYYISLCQIEHNTTSQTLEISLKVFTDDLERCVGKYSRESLHLGEPAEHPKANEILNQYFSDKLKFSNNNQNFELNWIGKEVGVEETWCYIEVLLTSKDIESLNIENRIFTELFSTQINMVKFKSSLAKDQDFNFSKSDFNGTIQLR